MGQSRATGQTPDLDEPYPQEKQWSRGRQAPARGPAVLYRLGEEGLPREACLL